MSFFNQVRAVIFDHDGTLVDSEPVHRACWQKALTPFNAQLSPAQYSEHLSGIPSIRSAQWLIAEFNLTAAADTLLQSKQSYLKSYLAEQACPLMASVRPLLEQLEHLNMPLAVASGAGTDEVQRSLRYHQLHRFFPVVVTKDDVINNKPEPDVYLAAAAGLGVAAEHCLAIEDSDSGQASALAAGMRCLRLDTPSRLPRDPRCQLITELGVLLNR